MAVDFRTKLVLGQVSAVNDQSAAKAAAGSTGEDNDATALNANDANRGGGKKNRKKNKKQ